MIGLPAPELFNLEKSRWFEIWRPITSMSYFGPPRSDNTHLLSNTMSITLIHSFHEVNSAYIILSPSFCTAHPIITSSARSTTPPPLPFPSLVCPYHLTHLSTFLTSSSRTLPLQHEYGKQFIFSYPIWSDIRNNQWHW